MWKEFCINTYLLILSMLIGVKWPILQLILWNSFLIIFVHQFLQVLTLSRTVSWVVDRSNMSWYWPQRVQQQVYDWHWFSTSPGLHNFNNGKSSLLYGGFYLAAGLLGLKLHKYFDYCTFRSTITCLRTWTMMSINR